MVLFSRIALVCLAAFALYASQQLEAKPHDPALGQALALVLVSLAFILDK